MLGPLVGLRFGAIAPHEGRKCLILAQGRHGLASGVGRTLDYFKVPRREKVEVLAAFAAHKDEVTAGYVASTKAR
jgi:hypothetical protein